MAIFSSLREEHILKVEELRENFLNLVNDKDIYKLIDFINIVKKIDSLSYKVKNSLEENSKIEKYKRDLEKNESKKEEYLKFFGEEVFRVVFRFVIMVNIMRVKGLLKKDNFLYWLTSRGSDFNYYSYRG